MLIGYFNAEISDLHLEIFFCEYVVKSLSKEKTCFKRISNPNCIDFFLTNNEASFQNTKTVSTGLSDFYKIVLTVLKVSIVKINTQEMQYNNDKYFDSRKFNRDFKEEFSHKRVDTCNKIDEVFLKF